MENMQHQQLTVLRTVIAGIIGLFGFLIVNMIGFRVADPILFDPNVQSPKLMAVWNKIEPLPPAHGLIATLSILVLIGIGRAFVYRWLAPSWPSGFAARAIRYWMLVWFLSYFFVEFSAPFTLFGEPVGLILIELVILGVAVLTEAFVVAGIMESSKAQAAKG
jgi:hypothetical protein